MRANHEFQQIAAGLRAQVKRAFSNTAAPHETAICDPGTYPDNLEIQKRLGGRPWYSVQTAEYVRLWEAPTYLSVEGFAHYIPGFMLAALSENVTPFLEERCLLALDPRPAPARFNQVKRQLSIPQLRVISDVLKFLIEIDPGSAGQWDAIWKFWSPDSNEEVS